MPPFLRLIRKQGIKSEVKRCGFTVSNIGFLFRKSKESYAEIVNDSINETISRTLLTSFTTFVVVLVLFLSGVEAIAGFTFAMLVGVVVGTYSSIFIASPILIFMRPAEVKKK